MYIHTTYRDRYIRIIVKYVNINIYIYAYSIYIDIYIYIHAQPPKKQTC